MQREATLEEWDKRAQELGFKNLRQCLIHHQKNRTLKVLQYDFNTTNKTVNRWMTILGIPKNKVNIKPDYFNQIAKQYGFRSFRKYLLANYAQSKDDRPEKMTAGEIAPKFKVSRDTIRKWAKHYGLKSPLKGPLKGNQHNQKVIINPRDFGFISEKAMWTTWFNAGIVPNAMAKRIKDKGIKFSFQQVKYKLARFGLIPQEEARTRHKQQEEVPATLIYPKGESNEHFGV